MNIALIDDEAAILENVRKRIERGYIINVSHIASMKDGMVQMDNGARIFVNRISFKKIKGKVMTAKNAFLRIMG